MSQENSFYLYYDPRKSKKKWNNNPKNRKHCFYCSSTYQVSKKHIGFCIWLLCSFNNTKIESYDLTWGYVLMGLFQKQIHESSFFWQLSVANIIICFQTFFRWKLRSCLNYPSTLKLHLKSIGWKKSLEMLRRNQKCTKIRLCIRNHESNR